MLPRMRHRGNRNEGSLWVERALSDMAEWQAKEDIFAWL
jgi:hypothetical protein